MRRIQVIAVWISKSTIQVPWLSDYYIPKYRRAIRQKQGFGLVCVLSGAAIIGENGSTPNGEVAEAHHP
jgi:hypothetical protein